MTSATLTEELLPCPFCVKPAVFVPDNSYGDCWVGCAFCDVGFVEHKEYPDVIHKRWNRRPQPEEAKVCETSAEAMTRLSQTHDWCPSCKRGWTFAPPTDCVVPPLESKEFYDLMQTYRHWPMADQCGTQAAFDAVRSFISAGAK